MAPDLDIVALTGDEPVSAADIERITLAFFSSDAWPERTPAFMRVALDATNLRWLHTMSAGVDNPIFGMFTGRGVEVTTSSGASAEPIAATAMMYLLALSRGLPDLFRAQAAHEWRPKRFRELAGTADRGRRLRPDRRARGPVGGLARHASHHRATTGPRR